MEMYRSDLVLVSDGIGREQRKLIRDQVTLLATIHTRGTRNEYKTGCPRLLYRDGYPPLNCLEAGRVPTSPIRQVRGSREIAYCKQGIGATNGEGY